MNLRRRHHNTTAAHITQPLTRVIVHDITAVLFGTGAPLRHLAPDPRSGAGHE